MHACRPPWPLLMLNPGRQNRARTCGGQLAARRRCRGVFRVQGCVQHVQSPPPLPVLPARAAVLPLSTAGFADRCSVQAAVRSGWQAALRAASARAPSASSARRRSRRSTLHCRPAGFSHPHRPSRKPPSAAAACPARTSARQTHESALFFAWLMLNVKGKGWVFSRG